MLVLWRGIQKVPSTPDLPPSAHKLGWFGLVNCIFDVPWEFAREKQASKDLFSTESSLVGIY